MDLHTLKIDVENIALTCLKRPVKVLCTNHTLEVEEDFLMVPVGNKVQVGQVHTFPTPEGQSEDIETLGLFSRAEAITQVITEIFRHDIIRELEDQARAQAFGQG